MQARGYLENQVKRTGLHTRKSFLIVLSATLPAFFLCGCGLISGDSKIGEGIVIAPKLKIRSSTAPVALDLI